MPMKLDRENGLANGCLCLAKPTIERLTCFGESRNEGAAVVRPKSNTAVCCANSKMTDFSWRKIFN